MTREEKYDSIVGPYTPTFSPDTTVVTRKDGTSLYGFVDLGGYGNDEEMRKTQKFMFVPNNNSVAFRDEMNSTKKKNPVHCVQVDVDDVAHIKLVDGNRQIKMEHSFN